MRLVLPISGSFAVLERAVQVPRHILACKRIQRLLTSRPTPTCISAAATLNDAMPAAEGWNLITSGTRREWHRSDLHVVLVHPQIPQNAGNIARTCSATAVALHLVGPLGFTIDDSKLKRAGLDYWDWVAVKVHESWDDFYSFFKSLPGEQKLFGFSKLGKAHYAQDGLYRVGPPGNSSDGPGGASWLMFGAETTGLPPEAHAAAADSGGVVKIPILNYRHVRSLNLSTSVGIGVFEAIRQLDGAVLPEDVEGEKVAMSESLEAAAIIESNS